MGWRAGECGQTCVRPFSRTRLKLSLGSIYSASILPNRRNLAGDYPGPPSSAGGCGFRNARTKPHHMRNRHWSCAVAIAQARSIHRSEAATCGPGKVLRRIGRSLQKYLSPSS